MPLPRVHAVLKRNKGERHESSDIHITKLAQIKDIESHPVTIKPEQGDMAEPNCTLTQLDDSHDVPIQLDGACVTSTPASQHKSVTSSSKPVTHSRPEEKRSLRKDLTLDFSDSLLPRTRHDSTHHAPKSKQSWLLRLFESKLFDMSLAVTYLFNSKEQGVQVYIGELRNCVFSHVYLFRLNFTLRLSS